MKKAFLVLVLFFMTVSFVFAGQGNLSVPLSSDAYRIISNAEMRGIIAEQPDVKPYSLSTVRTLLETIATSSKTTEAEKQVIASILIGFEESYGGKNAENLKELMTTGYLQLPTPEGFEVNAGAKILTEQTASLTTKDLDSRNSVTFYLAGDITKYASFYMDFGYMLDKINHKAFLVTDFESRCEGPYLGLSEGGLAYSVSPFSSYASGLAMNPELGATVLDGKLSMRFGAVKRDWGPGKNNLALAGSARVFDAIEMTYTPSSWFSFSILQGSLGKGMLSLGTEEAPIMSDTFWHSDVYDNNFALQRIEVSPIKGLKASIYESVIYRKRLEIAYLNPLSVFMFAQNYIGDFDNMLAGLDVSYTLENVGRVYGGLAIDEMNSKNPKTIISFARNILALQGGVELPLPVASFSNLTMQATYIPPFFGTHYDYSFNPWGSGSNDQNKRFSASYVNKGQNLGYPLYPDSLELLASFDTTLPYGISLNVTIKDQMRSAQYANSTQYGTTMATIMNYEKSIDYVNKKFFSNIWNNIVDIEVSGKKSLDTFPMTISAGVQCLIDSRQTYSFDSTVKNYPTENTEDFGHIYNPSTQIYNFGTGTIYNHDWSTSVKLIAKLGFSLYY